MKSNHYDRTIKVLEALTNAGANIEKPHNIEHHIYCYTEADFRSLKTQGEALGYTVKCLGESEYNQKPLWQIDLVKPTKPNLQAIELQSLEIEFLTEKCNADYDGWGTEVET